MLELFLAVCLAQAVEVERVLAVVNGAPVLASDVDLAAVARLVPREEGESEAPYRRAVAEALVALELRWQDLQATGIAARVDVDVTAAWKAVLERAGGAAALAAALAQIGLPEPALRELVRRGAVVEAYVASRFSPFARPTPQEVEETWQRELAPALVAAGKPAPELAAVREQVEALVRERKLAAEVTRWTALLERRAEVIRYLR
ncbi:MAG: hypothetical protein V1750_06705 [Acidobacteriota bacterium]